MPKLSDNYFNLLTRRIYSLIKLYLLITLRIIKKEKKMWLHESTHRQRKVKVMSRLAASQILQSNEICLDVSCSESENDTIEDRTDTDEDENSTMWLKVILIYEDNM